MGTESYLCTILNNVYNLRKKSPLKNIFPLNMFVDLFTHLNIQN